MLIIINRLGIIGLFYAFIPMIAGSQLSFFVGSLIGPSSASTDGTEIRRSASGKPMKPAKQPSRAAGMAISFVLCAGLTAWAWFIRKSVIANERGGFSAGAWNAIIGGAYLLGVVFGAIMIFSMPK